MTVYNISGTGDNTCACGSWLKHWEKYSNKALPVHCAEVSCLQNPEVGAHVQQDSVADSDWYIVPLCKMHNAKRGESLEILTVKLVSANVQETCGK